MISFHDALCLISTKVQAAPRASERVDLANALGRTCAADVASEENFPMRLTSAMDGFAMDSLVTRSASPRSPLAIRIRGEIAAGDEPPTQTENGCWEIMTGATLPDDCDTCIRVEDVVLKDNAILISAPSLPGAHIRKPGEDLRQGDVIIKRGQIIRSEDILCLATLGRKTITVYKKPRVAIIATGKELSSSDQILKHSAQVRNSTTPFLLAALSERGANATFLGAVADEPDAFYSLFDQANKDNYDLVLTTGALSVGRHDFIASALSARDTTLFFQKVTIRPGKPLLFGQTQNGPFIIGLPGNPIASLVGLRFFVDAFLRAWLQQESERPLRLPLLDETLKKPSGVTSFFRASLCPETGAVRTHSQQRASLLSPLLETDVWIQLPEQTTQAQRGDIVSAWPYLSTLGRRNGSP